MYWLHRKSDNPMIFLKLPYLRPIPLFMIGNQQKLQYRTSTNRGLILLVILGAFCQCSKNEQADEEEDNSVSALSQEGEVANPASYKEAMRSFIIKISQHAKKKNPKFQIVVNQGYELIVKDDSINQIHDEYLAAIDGILTESLFWTWIKDDEGNISYQESSHDLSYVSHYLRKAKTSQKPIFSIDYTDDGKTENSANRAASYASNRQEGYISFQGNIYLDQIPRSITDENNKNIETLKDGANFLYIFEPNNIAKNSSNRKALAIELYKDTNYDIIFTSAYYQNNNGREFDWFTADEIYDFNVKKNGGSRLIIAYMNIGSLSKSNYYYKNYDIDPSGSVPWLGEKDSFWEEYNVKYWYPFWEKIIIYNEDRTDIKSFLDNIIDGGFDGVILDNVNKYWYWDNI